jgi:hypothetical protein
MAGCIVMEERVGQKLVLPAGSLLLCTYTGQEAAEFSGIKTLREHLHL